MKTFHETFKDRIDMTDGTVVLTEKAYKEIQRDALQHAMAVITNHGEYGLTTRDMIEDLEKDIEGTQI